jgi:hypothetical protein
MRLQGSRPLEQRLFFAGEATHSCDFSIANGGDDVGLCGAEEVIAALWPNRGPEPVDRSSIWRNPRPGQPQRDRTRLPPVGKFAQLLGRKHAMQSRSMKTLNLAAWSTRADLWRHARSGRSLCPNGR